MCFLEVCLSRATWRLSISGRVPYLDIKAPKIMKTHLFVVTGNITVVNYSYDSPYVYYAINTKFLLMASCKILHRGPLGKEQN